MDPPSHDQPPRLGARPRAGSSPKPGGGGAYEESRVGEALESSMRNWSARAASTTGCPPIRLEPGQAARWRVTRWIDSGPASAITTAIGVGPWGPSAALWVASIP